MNADRSSRKDSELARGATQGIVSSSRRPLGALSKKQHPSASLAKALRKQYDILESYAPRWYTQEHHERAGSALRRGGKALADVFMELSDLLEEYAPNWYTKDHYETDRSILKPLKKSKTPAAREGSRLKQAAPIHPWNL